MIRRIRHDAIRSKLYLVPRQNPVLEAGSKGLWGLGRSKSPTLVLSEMSMFIPRLFFIRGFRRMK